jgi:hypothetical protein
MFSRSAASSPRRRSTTVEPGSPRLAVRVVPTAGTEWAPGRRDASADTQREVITPVRPREAVGTESDNRGHLGGGLPQAPVVHGSFPDRSGVHQHSPGIEHRPPFSVPVDINVCTGRQSELTTTTVQLERSHALERARPHRLPSASWLEMRSRQDVGTPGPFESADERVQALGCQQSEGLDDFAGGHRNLSRPTEYVHQF